MKMSQELRNQLTLDYLQGKITEENVAEQFVIAGESQEEWVNWCNIVNKTIRTITKIAFTHGSSDMEVVSL